MRCQKNEQFAFQKSHCFRSSSGDFATVACRQSAETSFTLQLRHSAPTQARHFKGRGNPKDWQKHSSNWQPERQEDLERSAEDDYSGVARRRGGCRLWHPGSVEPSKEQDGILWSRRQSQCSRDEWQAPKGALLTNPEGVPLCRLCTCC